MSGIPRKLIYGWFEDWDTTVSLLRQMARALGGVRTLEEFVYLVGDSWNGKDTLVALMLQTLGDGVGGTGYVVPLDGKFFATAHDPNLPSPALDVLQGARFVPVGELRDDLVFDNEELKRLTECQGTMVVTHGKNRDPRAWHPCFLIRLHANLMVRLNFSDKAILRRLSIYQFPLRFVPEQSDPPIGNERLQDPTIKVRIDQFASHLLFVAMLLSPSIKANRSTRLMPTPPAVRYAVYDYVPPVVDGMHGEPPRTPEHAAKTFVAEMMKQYQAGDRLTTRDEVKKAFMLYCVEKHVAGVLTAGKANGFLVSASLDPASKTQGKAVYKKVVLGSAPLVWVLSRPLVAVEATAPEAVGEEVPE